MKWILRIACTAIVSLALAACLGNKRLQFSSIFVGSKGPEISGVFFYNSAGDVENSWIKTALTQEELLNVVRAVDFEHQILLAFASGHKNLPSDSSIAITQVIQAGSRDHRTVDVSVKIGRCGSVMKESRLFILAALERPTGSVRGEGYDAHSTDFCNENGVPK